ncbi:MAG: hypothetical protein HC905_00980 [Bacteroidales bacterium]|nr:hypothetical protein [Bacteroidales bacterium]
MKKNERANEVIELIINDLRKLWTGETFNAILIKKRIEELDDFQLSVLNKSSAFEPKMDSQEFTIGYQLLKRSIIIFLILYLIVKKLN